MLRDRGGVSGGGDGGFGDGDGGFGENIKYIERICMSLSTS